MVFGQNRIIKVPTYILVSVQKVLFENFGVVLQIIEVPKTVSTVIYFSIILDIEGMKATVNFPVLASNFSHITGIEPFLIKNIGNLAFLLAFIILVIPFRNFL